MQNHSVRFLGNQEINCHFVPQGNSMQVFFEGGNCQKASTLYNLLYKNSENKLANCTHELPENTQITLPHPDYMQNVYKWKKFDNAWRIEQKIGKIEAVKPKQQIWSNPENAEILLIDSLSENEAADYNNLISENTKKIVLTIQPGFFQTGLWHELYKNHIEKTIIMLDIDDLRSQNISISKGISWEKTLENLLDEIYKKRNPNFFALRECPYVFITIGQSGLLLLINSDNPECHFYFENQAAEGEWEKHHPGNLIGKNAVLHALAAYCLNLETDETSQVQKLAETAFSTLQLFQKNGFCFDETFSFPYDGMSNHILNSLQSDNTAKNQDKGYVNFPVAFFLKQAENQDEKWSLMDISETKAYAELAREIVQYGPESVLSGISMCKIGALLTIDRDEIEGFRFIKNLIANYLYQRNENQPLSIAVFGNPGSGKSFGVKQIAKSFAAEGYSISKITFNLSQFNDPDELYQAFHQIRDISLSGDIPLVFWDEFDTDQLKWLRYFLAPMQDGEFQEGQLTHNIGKSIFVFAGGTCNSINRFHEVCRENKDLKGPDFFSRLKGSINIKGPNPIDIYEKNDDSVYHEDGYYILRRAILLHSMLSRFARSIFRKDEHGRKKAHIEEGLITAFLEIPEFYHGARSMETIIKISRLEDADTFSRSALPPSKELNIHVDGDAFINLIQSVVLSDKQIESMAREIHKAWKLMKESKNFTADPAETQKIFTESLIDYDSLSRDEKRQNLASARHVLAHLRHINLDIIPLKSEKPLFQFSKEQVQSLSRLEHIRWVKTHIEAGWSYAPETNKALHQHNNLIPWDEKEAKNAEAVYGKGYAELLGDKYLTEDEKDYDRAIVRAYPYILQAVGFEIVES